MVQCKASFLHRCHSPTTLHSYRLPMTLSTSPSYMLALKGFFKVKEEKLS